MSKGSAVKNIMIGRGTGRGWRRAVAPAILIAMFAGLTAIGMLFEDGRTREANEDLRLSLVDQLHTLRARIDGRIIGNVTIARALMSRVETNPDISQDEFSRFADRLMQKDSALVNIALARGLVVEYVHPYAPNRRVIGLDYRTTPAQLAGIERAIELRAATFVGPVDLVQGFPGFVIRTPVFVDANDDTSSYWGVASIVLDSAAFLREVGINDSLPFDIAILSRDATGKETVIHGNPGIIARDAVHIEVPLPKTAWQVYALPKGGWLTHGPDPMLWRAIYALTVLLILSGVGYMLHLYARRRQAEQRLASAIEAVDDGFAIYDAQDRYVNSNHRYRELYDLTTDLFRPGTPFETIIREGVRRGQYPDAAGREDEWIAERLAAHRTANTEIEQQIADGRWLRISERRTSDGSTVGFRVDITELKNAKEAALRANRAKSDFFGVLSHELRTPLTIILGHAKILSQIGVVPAAKDLVTHVESLPQGSAARASAEKTLDLVAAQSTKIVKSGDHLLSLINQMLDLSKVEAEQMDFEIEPVPVPAILDTLRDQFADAAAERGLSLTVASEEISVAADPARLTQVLINLVGNALKFTEQGGIVVSAVTEGQTAVFSVTDSGCGIPERELSRVFEEFHQVDSTATRRVGGTGLGLAITRQMVEAMGGEISVESTVGQGSTFVFSLALAEGEQVGTGRNLAAE